MLYVPELSHACDSTIPRHSGATDYTRSDEYPQTRPVSDVVIKPVTDAVRSGSRMTGLFMETVTCNRSRRLTKGRLLWASLQIFILAECTIYSSRGSTVKSGGHESPPRFPLPTITLSCGDIESTASLMTTFNLSCLFRRSGRLPATLTPKFALEGGKRR